MTCTNPSLACTISGTPPGYFNRIDPIERCSLLLLQYSGWFDIVHNSQRLPQKPDSGPPNFDFYESFAISPHTVISNANAPSLQVFACMMPLLYPMTTIDSALKEFFGGESRHNREAYDPRPKPGHHRQIYGSGRPTKRQNPVDDPEHNAHDGRQSASRTPLYRRTPLRLYKDWRETLMCAYEQPNSQYRYATVERGPRYVSTQCLCFVRLEANLHQAHQCTRSLRPPITHSQSERSRLAATTTTDINAGCLRATR